MGLGYEPGGVHNNNLGEKYKPKKRPGFSDYMHRDQGPNNMPGDRTNGSELNDNLPENPSQPSPPSTQQPTSPDPQEFADQKKEEVKKTYSTSHADRINNAYRDHYGRNAHADEIANWTGTGMGIEDIQKGLKTSFARDGEHLGEDQLANLQIPQEPQQPQQPQQPSQPDVPRPTPIRPSEPEPSNFDNHEKRFAASNQFRDELNSAKNLGQTSSQQTSSQQTSAQQTPASQTPASQTPASQTPASQTSTSSSPNAESIINSSQGTIDNNQGVNIGRQRIDNMLNTSSNSFNNQMQREADMRASSPNTQDSTDFYQKFSLLNEDAQRGRGDFSSIINQAIQGGRDNRAIDTAALDMDLRRNLQNNQDRADLFNFRIFGDMGRNSRENPYSWTPSQPTPKVETPDFRNIYRDTLKDINGI